MVAVAIFVPCGATKRFQEVEELRQKLQEVELGTALSQADSNFLQRELEEKEADIGEWQGGQHNLTAVTQPVHKLWRALLCEGRGRRLVIRSSLLPPPSVLMTWHQFGMLLCVLSLESIRLL